MKQDTLLDLSPWIDEYETYLKAHGYTDKSIRSRLRYLGCFEQFVQARALTSLEAFRPAHMVEFIDYWLQNHPTARTSEGFSRKQRFEPSHHIGLQYGLRSFLRWARSVGHLHCDLFPWREPVRGHYFFPETSEYLDFCQQHKGLATNTIHQIELFCRRFDHFLHHRRIDDLNQLKADHIDLFVRRQASRNIRRVQRVQKILRGFFRYLFSRGRLDRDWAAALISPRQYRLAHTPRALKPEQILHLLNSIDRQRAGGKRDFAVLLMAATLGVRAGEIAGLRLDDLDWKHERVRFHQTKTQNLLHLPLSRPLMEALADYLKNERPKNSRYREVFLRFYAPHTPLRPAAVSGLIARRMRKAGLGASAHQLRHGFAGELLKTGVAYSTLQELLGHRHFTSTQIYTKIDLSQLREVADNDARQY
ncbi:MAG: site-specific integrase [Spirochaetia bacterium]